MGSGQPVILLTGASGQVGTELRAVLAPLGRLLTPSREELDLTDAAALRRFVDTTRPAVVVNAAAYTEVDRAESDRETARRANADAPASLAEAAADIDAIMIHYSTDYVFDGTSARPYRESDATRPLNVYGETKRDGELGVAAAGGTHLVLRTSWVYGAHGRNFLRTVLRLAAEREELRIVDDQVGAPTWSRSIAEATGALLAPALGGGAGREALRAASGVYHLSAEGETSWCGFARAIVEGMPAVSGRPKARVVPIMSEDYPTAATRPARSVLDSSLMRARFGVSLGGWREGLAGALGDLESGEG